MSASTAPSADATANNAAAQTRWSRREAVAVSAIVALGLGLRLAGLWAWPPTEPMGDEYDYLALAQGLIDSGTFDAVGRAPGYAWFLAAVGGLSSDLAQAGRLAQIGLAGMSIVLLYLIGRRALWPPAALIAAGLFAIDPTLIAFSHQLYTETLFIALLLAAAWTWLRAVATGRSLAFAACGALFGVATLVRGGTWVHVAALALWTAVMCIRSRAAAPGEAAAGAVASAQAFPPGRSRWTLATTQVACFLLGWALLVAPYSVHVSLRNGRFVLVDTSAARTLWHANRLEYVPGYDWGITGPRVRAAERKWGVKHPPLEHETAESAAAIMRQELAFVREHAGLILSRVPEKWASLWNPTNYLQRRIARGQMQGVERESAAGRIIGIGSTAMYALTLFLGVVGFWHARRGGLRSFTLVMFVVLMLVHAAMVSFSRYRLPIMPFVFLYAATALCEAGRCFAWRHWRTWAAAGTMALLIASWRPYWPYALMRVSEAPRVRPERRAETEPPRRPHADVPTIEFIA